MAEYRVYFRESVEKDFSVIPKKDLRIRLLIESRRSPRIPDPLATKNSPVKNVIAFVKAGTGRTVYSIQDKDLTVWVVKVGATRFAVT